MDLAVSRFRRLFRKSQVINGNPRGLPPELLEEIVSYIEDWKTLFRLCRVSRLFRCIAEAACYKSIKVGYRPQRLPPPMRMDLVLRPQQFMKLCSMIQGHRFASLITDFRFFFPVYRPGHQTKYRCDDTDSVLGATLPLLENLQILHIHCESSFNSNRTRHRHLKNLKTDKLQEFRFVCRCHRYGGEDSRHEFLYAPFMRNVVALSYPEWGVTDAYIPSTNADPLWGIRRLFYTFPLYNFSIQSGGRVMEPLISQNLLTHFGCDRYTEELHQLLSRCAKALIHLSFSRVDPYLPEPLNVHRGGDPPFPHLQHVGYVTWRPITWDNYSQRRKLIKQLMDHFPELASVHMNITEPNIWLTTESMVDWLKEISTLRKIYISIEWENRGEVWKLMESGWVSQPVPMFTQWELMMGRV